MCKTDDGSMKKKSEAAAAAVPAVLVGQERRRKRDKVGAYTLLQRSSNDDATKRTASTTTTTKKPKKQSRAFQKHKDAGPSGGIESLLPSLFGVVILVMAVMAKMGFRGRATTAGIDLGTTNSVICVQAPSKGVGEITCIPDPNTNSTIVPSVVSFLEPSERMMLKKKKKKSESKLSPPPTHVVVGQAAKNRIDSHPHQTLYHAKRLLGRTPQEVAHLQREVEFEITHSGNKDDDGSSIGMKVAHEHSMLSVSPIQVGSYVVQHLMEMTSDYLGHENVKSAVICVPAKFNAQQRIETVQAFRDAGVTVTRIMDEPSAAALAYGLHKKEGVDYILVYDFGGGTLDVSLLQVTQGFVDVMGSDGDETLGGADFDDAVAQLLQVQVTSGTALSAALESLHRVIPDDADLEVQIMKECPVLDMTPLCTLSSLHMIGEKLKIELSSNTDKQVVTSSCLTTTTDAMKAPFTSVAAFCSSLTPVPLTLTLDEYDKAVQPLYDRSVLPIRRLLKDLDLVSTDIHEVVMVGGTTKMPQVRSLVKAELQVEALNTHIDPDITVAYGAASVID